MKRRHRRADTIGFCDAVRRLRPEAAFGADLIAGFPTETEAMFENTLALVADAGLSYLHVFPFSPRARTPAARMPQLPRAVVKERAARLRAAGDAALASRLRSLVGSDQDILMEKPGEGRTPCFALARLDAAASPGDIVRARISSSGGRTLGAQILRSAA
jgi:threonylcarbamoyladenosine tRNA methylthiotransferase MtaB